jgi:2'-5' RNA ligase
VTHDFASRDHSGLVVALPELESFIGHWRSRYDAAVSGVPAHITLLVPWVPPAEITVADLDAVAQLAKSSRPFTVSFRDFGVFENPDGPDVYWLAPEPADEFLALIDDVVTCWPDYPPYEGAHGNDVTPHLTVSSTAAAIEVEEMLAAVRDLLPVTARADQISVLEVAGGRCTTRQSFRLGGKKR